MADKSQSNREPDTRDAFEQLLGPGRGIADATARALLSTSEHELLAAQREIQRLRADSAEHDAETERARERTEELNSKLDQKRFELVRTENYLTRARYALVRADLPDPLAYIAAAEHHGIWTPGRPYLIAQHVYDPATWHCYTPANEEGVKAGRRPGRTLAWQRCIRSRLGCPAPPSVSMQPHPVASGYAVRQECSWWDAQCRAWPLEKLSDEHLLRVIDWLEDNLVNIFIAELGRYPALVPCPPNAYVGADEWLADTPLMRALLAEKRKRRLRRRPQRDRPTTYGTQHAF